MMSPPRVPMLVAVVMLSTACGGDEEGAVDQRSRAQVAVEGLCEAEQLASGGQPAEARETFQDRSHAFLHELAADLQESNRPLATQLLEAKQEVEAGLQSGGEPQLLASRISSLRAVVESSLVLLGRPTVGCVK
jgi:hypothetical protein